MEENTTNLEEAKAALQKQMEEMKNKTYPDWDSIVVQINLGKTGVQTIKMMRQDLEVLAENHGATRADVVEMLLQALEEEFKNSGTAKDKKNAVS